MISAIVIALLAFLLKPVRVWFKAQWDKLIAIWNAWKRLRFLLNAVEGDGVWKAIPPKPPAKYAEFFLSPRPILTVANLKGGVGKTTIAANLAAYFALESKKNAQLERVLLIDLDFQGTLSAMVLGKGGDAPQRNTLSRAAQLIAGKIPRDLLAYAAASPEVRGLSAITSHFDLAQMENRLLIQWLAHHRTPEIKLEEIRYTLAELLHNPDLPYDRVIIDAPPRMTTGMVQALAASTHVLIPTILDGASAGAVKTFIDQIESHRTIWPYLKYAGVCASMTAVDVGAWLEKHPDKDFQEALRIAERLGYRSVQDALGRLSQDSTTKLPVLLPADTMIADTVSIAQASGENIAYSHIKEDERAMFRRLGAEVALRMSQ